MASSRKSRRKSAKAEPVPSPSKPSIIIRALKGVWRPFPLFLTAVSVSGVMFWPEIVQRLPDLHRRPEYQLPWSELSVTPPGRWVPPGLVGQVLQLSGLPDPLPVLDEDLAEQLAEAFARHPWVASVQSVMKSSPHTLRLELTYRDPVLMVRTKRGYYPVDRDGVLLPPSDFALADTERFPVVEGVRSVPAGPAGTLWGDQAVLGAARLGELLARRDRRSSAWEKFGMSAIRILLPDHSAETLHEVMLGVTTHAGSQIVWGRPPGADSLEPTAQQKLLRLEKYLPEYGSAEWRGAPVRIDIRQWDVIKQHELSGNPPQRGEWR